MFSNELNNLNELGKAFTTAFAELVKTTTAQADEQVNTIRGAYNKLVVITATQESMARTAREIASTMDDMADCLDETAARNDIVLAHLDEMDIALEGEDEDEEDEDEDCEVIE